MLGIAPQQILTMSAQLVRSKQDFWHMLLPSEALA